MFFKVSSGEGTPAKMQKYLAMINQSYKNLFMSKQIMFIIAHKGIIFYLAKIPLSFSRTS